MNKPNDKGLSEVLPVIVPDLITDLKKIYPPKEIEPGMTMDQIFFNAGIQSVITFIERVHILQKERTK